MLTVLYKSVLM